MRLTALAALATALVLPANAAPARDPSGLWLTGDGRARVKVERCATKPATVCGTVAWLKVPLTGEGQPRTDLRNPDPAKRGRPVIGMPLMQELAADADGRFKGEIYNAEEGRSYEVAIGLGGANDLTVEGCLLGILCGAQTWSRVAEPVQQTGEAKPAPRAAPAGPATTGSTTPRLAPAAR